jgi:hypothetical protein
MPKTALMGSRIRERRQVLGMKQAELARAAGISASYLNLIEHNRRKIGGKVLLGIAQALQVDVTALTEGAEEALLDALREAAAVSRRDEAETDRMEEFVARFPGWAQLVAAQRRRILSQDRSIAALNDRLTHDPVLSEAMHDILSTVTAIRSTVSILAETPELEAVWRDRFLRNLQEESTRLVDGSQSLVSYFEDQVRTDTPFTTPLEALEVFLARRDFHLPDLETLAGPEAVAPAVEALLEAAEELNTPQARALGQTYLTRYARLALRLPADRIAALWRETPDPGALARQTRVGLADIMLRLALVPAEALGTRLGLVICDAAGALLFRKVPDGFPVPRFGAACAVWPLFQALSRPTIPAHALVETPPGRRFETWTVATPEGIAGFDTPPVFRAAMLIGPDTGALPPESAAPVGTTCRICPRPGCTARREPSILLE